MDTTQELSKVIWKRIVADLGIPVLGNPKIKDIRHLRKKVEELLDSIPFEEDELLEAMDKEFVSRWAKSLRLPLTDINIDTEKVDTRAEAISMMNKEELGKWSDEAYELGVLLLKLNYLPQICNETYIRFHFKSFKFEAEKVTLIGEDFKKFENLMRLDISDNKIRVLQNLPSQLTELNVYNNQITDIKAGQLPSLKHLGIGHNRLTGQSLCIVYWLMNSTSS